jgi:hypothetical protein
MVLLILILVGDTFQQWLVEQASRFNPVMNLCWRALETEGRQAAHTRLEADAVA